MAISKALQTRWNTPEIRIRLLRRPQRRNRPGRQQAYLGIQRRLPGDRDRQPTRQRRGGETSGIHDQNRTGRARTADEDHRSAWRTRRNTRMTAMATVETITDGNSTKRNTPMMRTTSRPRPKRPTKRSPKQDTTRRAGHEPNRRQQTHHQIRAQPALEEVTEVIDPSGHKTIKEYDALGISRN